MVRCNLKMPRDFAATLLYNSNHTDCAQAHLEAGGKGLGRVSGESQSGGLYRFEDKFRSRMLANSSAEETHFLPGGR